MSDNRKRYVLTVSLPNHIEIEAACRCSDTMFATLKRFQYLVLSSGSDWPEAFLYIKDHSGTTVTRGKTRVNATFGKSLVLP